MWQSSGLGLLGWFKPILVYATPVVLVVGLLSLYLTPWAIGKTEEFRNQLENQDDVSAVAPAFSRIEERRRCSLSKISSDLSQVANIFVHSVQSQRQGVMVAKRGYANWPQRRPLSHFANGRRYEGTPGQADYRIVRFDRYAVRIEQSEATSLREVSRHRAVAPGSTPLNRSELTWRVGLPVSALILSFWRSRSR